MKQRHSIESAILNINFPNEEMAFERQQDLEAFAREKMLPIVEEVFDELSESDTVLRIDKLEVDLGEIGLGYFYEDFASRLKDKVKESLSMELASHYGAAAISGGASKRLSTRAADFEQLCEFLATGRMPWNASREFKSTIDRVLEDVLRVDGQRFLQFLRGSPAKTRVVNRLISQFGPERVVTILGLGLEVSIEEIKTLLDDLWSALGLGQSWERAPNLFWLELLSTAVLSGSSQRATGATLMLREIVRAASRLTGRKESQLFASLGSILLTQSTSRNSEIGESLRAAIELAIADSAQSAESSHELQALHVSWSHSSEIQSFDEVRLQGIREQLREAFRTGVSAPLQPKWATLLADFPVLIREIVTREGQHLESRRAIAHRFPESMIRDIVILLEPSEHQFIERLVAEPKTMLGKEHKLAIEENVAKRSLWEFTLTYLLVERGSQFNRKSYISSVSRQMAAHLNISIAELYQSVIEMLSNIQLPDGMHGELLLLLKELQAEQVSGSRSHSNPYSHSHNSGINGSFEAGAELNSRRWLSERLSLDEGSSGEVQRMQILKAAVSAFREKRVADLAALWSGITRNQRYWLRSLIESEGQQADVRRLMASEFSDSMLKDVLELLEPAAAAYIYESLRSQTLLQGTASSESDPGSHRVTARDMEFEESGAIPTANRELYVASWEFTLTYLLVERGSQFNKKSFLASVITKLAARENISEEIFYRTLLGNLAAAQQENALLAGMFDLLSELYRQSTGGTSQEVPDWSMDGSNLEIEQTPSQEQEMERGRKQGAPSFPDYFDSLSQSRPTDMEPLEIMRAYLLYEKLTEAIASTGSADVNVPYQVVRLLHEMTEHYPWKLHRFNQELNNGSLSLVSVLGKLPKALQRKLLLAFFRSFSRKYAFTLAEFERRLDQLSSKGRINQQLPGGATAAQPDYLQILERLIGNRVTDLDAIFAPLYGQQATEQPSSSSDFASSVKPATAELESDVSARTPELAEMLANQSGSRTFTQGSSLENLQNYLRGAGSSQSFDKSSLTTSIELMLNNQPGELSDLLKSLLQQSAASDRLVEILPESLLVKILLLLKPADHFKAVLYGDLMTMAWVESGAALGARSAELHQLKWKFIFDYLVIQRRTFSEVAFVRQLSKRFSDEDRRFGVSSSNERSAFYTRLAENIANASSASTHVPSVRISMILANLVSEDMSGAQVDAVSARQAETEPGAESAKRSSEIQAEAGYDQRRLNDQPDESEQAGRVQPSEGRNAANSESDLTGRDNESADLGSEAVASDAIEYEEDDSDILEDVYVENAGLVLLSPYLPRYFDMLGLMNGREFKDRAHAERGVHLLQFLLNESTENYEYQLVLNKVLCGIRAGIPICKSIVLSEEEVACSNNLLTGVLQNWPALKNTSIAGLRETFLQREAHLQLKDDAWHLQVDTKAFDMLLDGVPWNYSTIKHPWMEKPIYVNWR